MSNEELWDNFLQVIHSRIQSISYDTWFKDTSLISSDNGKLIIKVPMTFHKQFLSNTYYELIEETINNITGINYELEFVVEEDLEKIEENNEDLSYKRINSNLNEKYTFDNFIIGDSNRFAQTAALAVAEQPGKIYNPLFIYGKSGLGKTHLMHAIGNYIESHSNKVVLYASSEDFKKDFIDITSHKKDQDIVNHFKEKYRNIDVLMIDDIQFLAKAEETQQEFFHTFTTLYDSNKQIIITSDRSPDDLNILQERLVTRFRWGLTVNINPPDFELKCKILREKMSEHEVATMINSEVIEYIASNSENDVRWLQGAITRLYAYAAMMCPKEINLEFAIEALKDVIGSSIYTTNDIQKIQKAVAAYYQITVEDLKSKKRTSNINYPRQVAMYLCRMTTDETIVKIGLEFGNRDHSTVLHSCDKIASDLRTNIKLKETLEEIKNKIVN